MYGVKFRDNPLTQLKISH